jgi:hypothetical protein
MLFNGVNVDETVNITASRAGDFRAYIVNVVMTLDDMEAIVFWALGSTLRVLRRRISGRSSAPLSVMT